MSTHTLIIVQRFRGLPVDPVRVFDFWWAGMESIEETLRECEDLDELVETAEKAGLEVEEDPAEDAPWNVRPDVLIYAEQDAQGVWTLRRYEE